MFNFNVRVQNLGLRVRSAGVIVYDFIKRSLLHILILGLYVKLFLPDVVSSVSEMKMSEFAWKVVISLLIFVIAGMVHFLSTRWFRPSIQKGEIWLSGVAVTLSILFLWGGLSAFPSKKVESKLAVTSVPTVTTTAVTTVPAPAPVLPSKPDGLVWPSIGKGKVKSEVDLWVLGADTAAARMAYWILWEESENRIPGSAPSKFEFDQIRKFFESNFLKTSVDRSQVKARTEELLARWDLKVDADGNIIAQPEDQMKINNGIAALR